jgi:predicted AAA+ superfamily ATPase
VEYRRRVIDEQLDQWLTHLPAVAIEGAKGVGKTATASQRAADTFTLDRSITRRNVATDPELILTGRAPTFVDEWQRVPDVWDVVRHAVDRSAQPGRFLLAGSALPPDEVRLHSGAGRIVRALMRPLSLPERGIETPSVSFSSLMGGSRPPLSGRTGVGVAGYVDEILGSGFPGIRSATPSARGPLLDSYIDRIVDTHVPQEGGRIRRPAALRAWFTAYGAATATTASYPAILDAATPGVPDKPSRSTAITYTELLERIWVIEPLPAWLPAFAHLKRLGQAPKHHLVDPALAARALGVRAASLIAGIDDPPVPRNTTLLGALFESLATQTVRVLAQCHGARVSHMRIDGGAHEVDLIVERDDHRVLAIEAKLGASPSNSDVRHLSWLDRQLPGRVVDKIVLTSGQFAYRRPGDGIGIVPLALLGP